MSLPISATSWATYSVSAICSEADGVQPAVSNGAPIYDMTSISLSTKRHSEQPPRSKSLATRPARNAMAAARKKDRGQHVPDVSWIRSGSLSTGFLQYYPDV